MTAEDREVIAKALDNQIRIARYHFTTLGKRLNKVESKVFASIGEGEDAMKRVRKTKVYMDYMKHGKHLRALEGAAERFKKEAGE